MNRKRRRLRWQPRYYSKARVYGTLDGWSKYMKVHGKARKATSSRTWEREYFDDAA